MPQKLPKPAPMRVAQDTNSRRKPPLLPKTIVNIPDKDDVSAMASDSGSVSDSKVVDSTTPKFINNEQTQDFFQGAGDGPAGESVLGSFFDTVFRPANAANQPVSSTSERNGASLGGKPRRTSSAEYSHAHLKPIQYGCADRI